MGFCERFPELSVKSLLQDERRRKSSGLSRTALAGFSAINSVKFRTSSERTLTERVSNTAEGFSASAV